MMALIDQCLNSDELGMGGVPRHIEDKDAVATNACDSCCL